MCQYSADDGTATDWHLQHLMQLAMSRAGLVMVEATGVERTGRITPALPRPLFGRQRGGHRAGRSRPPAASRRPGTRFGIQIAHAGRKASTHAPWEGGRPLSQAEGAWQTVAPRPFRSWRVARAPAALDEAGLADVLDAFRQAAERASAGLRGDRAAHRARLSAGGVPFSSVATGAPTRYGGSLEERMRFPLEVAQSVRAVVPASVALGARITGTDWADGGVTPDDAVALAARLKALASTMCASRGAAAVPHMQIPLGPGYQVPMAAKVQAETGIVTRAVGLIVEPAQAEAIVASGQADCVALARAFLDDPRWVWHAAERLGARSPIPRSTRAPPPQWPGAAMARPGRSLAPRSDPPNAFSSPRLRALPTRARGYAPDTEPAPTRRPDDADNFR